MKEVYHTVVEFGKPRQPINYGKRGVKMYLRLSPEETVNLLRNWRPKCSNEALTAKPRNT